MKLPRLARRAIDTMRALARRHDAQTPPQEPWPLDQPLVWYNKLDCHSTRAAVENCLVMAANGAGKTSAIGRTLGLSYLREGEFGFCILCAKKDEPDWWLTLAEEAGRRDDVILFGHPDQSWRFNFLSYEASRAGDGAGLTENIVSQLLAVQEVLDPKRGRGGGGDNDPFWRGNDKMLLRNTVDTVLLSGSALTIDNLRAVVLSAPTSPEQCDSISWRAESPCWRMLELADKRALTPEQRHDLCVVADYWLRIFPQTPERTRGTFVTAFSAYSDLLARGALRTLFCTDTNVTPEDAMAGRVIVVAMPLHEYGDVGRIAATLWKQSMQRALLRRDVTKWPRPCVLWIDEAAHFLTEGDMLFASASRSAKAALVMLGHNVGAFYTALGGGESGKAETDALFSLMNTKIFGANSDFESCTWASNLIGQERKLFFSAGSNAGNEDWFSVLTGVGQNPTANASMNQQMAYSVEPTAYSMMRTGGPLNDYCVDSIVVQSGRLFKSTGTTWMPVTWHQKRERLTGTGSGSKCKRT